MKDERKEFDERQSYLPKSNQELTDFLEQQDTTNEARTDEPTHGKECYSKFPERTLMENDAAKHAQRLAVNYVRSLLLF